MNPWASGEGELHRALLAHFEAIATAKLRLVMKRLFEKALCARTGPEGLEISFAGDFTLRCAVPAAACAADIPASLARLAALHNGLELAQPNDAPLVLPPLDEAGTLTGVAAEWLEGADDADHFKPDALALAFYDGQDLAVLHRDEILEPGEHGLYRIDHGACLPEAAWDGLSVPEAFFLRVAEAVLGEELEGTVVPRDRTIQLGEDSYSCRATEIRIHGEELGTLPAAIGDFPRLKTLVILTTGTLRSLPEQLGQLRALRELVVNASRLESLPESLGRLGNLRKLSIISERLEQIPASLGELHKLEELELKGCFTRLPDELGRLPGLKELELESEALEALPESLGDLASLERLFVKRARLTCLPESLGKLSSLKRLSLIALPNLQALPESLGRLAALEQLHLNFCAALRGLPSTLGSLIALRELGARCLGFGDEAWPALCEARSLTRLELHGNRFTRVPKELAALAQLEFLSLDGAALECFPEVIASLTKLRTLELGSRGSALRLPDSFGQTRITSLCLQGWSMDELPAAILGLPLRRLRLRECKDLQRLPASMGSVSRTLEELAIADCPRLADLPPALKECEVLEELELTGTGAGWETIRHVKALKQLRVFSLTGALLGPRPEDLRSFEALVGSEDGVSYDRYDGKDARKRRDRTLASRVLAEAERAEPDFHAAERVLAEVLVHAPGKSFWNHYLSLLDKTVCGFGRLARGQLPAFHAFIHSILDAAPHQGGDPKLLENLLGNLIGAILGTDDPEQALRLRQLRALVPTPIQNDNLAFNLACACAKERDRAGVLEYCRIAKGLGRDRAVFLGEADLADYWSDPEFLASIG